MGKHNGRTGRISNASRQALAASHDITLPLGTKDSRKLLRNAVDPKLGLHVYNAVNQLRSQAQVNELVAMDFGAEFSFANPPKSAPITPPEDNQ